MTLVEEGKEQEAADLLVELLEFAEWDTAYVNDLPDSAFGYIAPGGKKVDGKTVPRSLRHFPHHNMGGDLDLPHLRNALARAPQSSFGPKAIGHLQSHAKSAGVGEAAKAHEVFVDGGWVVGCQFAEFGKPIQIIKTGSFNHPQLGKIIITKEDLEEMVHNFDTSIRGQQVPVDRDHKHEMGAVGWFKTLHGPTAVDGEYGLFADINWTDEGLELVKGGAFKYFSPHFGDWTDPQTHKKYNNVLLSGAITNFPFLKGMQPIGLNEFQEESMSDDARLVALETEVSGMKTQLSGIGEQITALVEATKKKNGGDTDQDGDDNDEDDDDADDDADDAELTERVKVLQESNTGLQKELVEAQKRISAIEREKRSIKFVEMITGHTANGIHWAGKVDKHLHLMESIADKFGEESAEFTDYVELQTSHAHQLQAAGLFTEIGSNGDGATGDELEVGVKKLMEADTKLTLSQATEQFLRKNPAYYAKADKAHKAKIAAAGG